MKRSNRKTKHLYYHCDACKVSPGANNYSASVNEYILSNATMTIPGKQSEPEDETEVIEISEEKRATDEPDEKEKPGLFERFLLELRQFIFGGW